MDKDDNLKAIHRGPEYKAVIHRWRNISILCRGSSLQDKITRFIKRFNKIYRRLKLIKVKC